VHGAGAIVMLQLLDVPDCPALSVTFATKVNVPAADGVPVT
jgi:hypothetical protein